MANRGERNEPSVAALLCGLQDACWTLRVIFVQCWDNQQLSTINIHVQQSRQRPAILIFIRNKNSRNATAGAYAGL